jgi:hypothetical protein
VVALAMVLVVLPFGSGFPLTDDPYPHYRAVPWLDLALLALVIAAAPLSVRRMRSARLGAGAGLWAAVVLLLAISFALQPTALGAQTLLRIVGVLAIAVTLASLGGVERALIVGVLAAVALLEVGVAALQLVAGAPLGVIGETPDPLLRQGQALLPRGTLSHSYVFTALGAVSALLIAEHALGSRRPALWSAIAGLAAVPVGLSCSRAALAGFGAACAVLATVARGDRWVRWLLVALLLGAGIPFLVQRDGWVARAEEGVDQASTLIAEHPLLGVGPGGYVGAARERFPDVPYTQSVHNVPLLVAAEGGIPAGLVVALMVLVLAWRAIRAGPAALALWCAFAPYVLVDALPYQAAQGTVLLGLWIGGLDRAAASPVAQWRTRSVPPVPAERRMASPAFDADPISLAARVSGHGTSRP